MARIVAAFAASHAPTMLNAPDAIPAVEREAIYGHFKTMAARLRAANPQAIVVLTTDHLQNFFFNNFPAVCIGAAPTYATPLELWLKAESRTIPGDAALGKYLLEQALNNGFEPSFSMDVTLDHGTLTPLHLAGLNDVPLVPIFINCVQPPMPSMARCLQWGQFLERALAGYPGLERVALLATGGLSHAIGTPTMGAVNEKFDRAFLDELEGADTSALVRYATDNVREGGNGAEEIRTWVACRGAVGSAPMEVIFYEVVPAWYGGFGIVQWQMAA